MPAVVLGTGDMVENKVSTLWTSGSHFRACSVSPSGPGRLGAGCSWDYLPLDLRVLSSIPVKDGSNKTMALPSSPLSF